MKIVYGGPNTVMTIGVALLGDVPTPFFGFVDKDKVVGEEMMKATTPAQDMLDKIEELGGTIIFIENPEAAERMHNLLSMLFSSAVDGDWGDVKKTEARLQ